jgi:hypothetical protein
MDMPRAGASQTFPSMTMTPSFDGLSCVQLRPWILRLIQAVASANKIVRRGDVIGGVQAQAAHPSLRARDSIARTMRSCGP